MAADPLGSDRHDTLEQTGAWQVNAGACDQIDLADPHQPNRTAARRCAPQAVARQFRRIDPKGIDRVIGRDRGGRVPFHLRKVVIRELGAIDLDRRQFRTLVDAERRGAQLAPQRRRYQVLPAVLLQVVEAVIPIQDELDLISGSEVVGPIDAVYDPRRRFRDADRAPRQRTTIGRLAASTG